MISHMLHACNAGIGPVSEWRVIRPGRGPTLPHTSSNGTAVPKGVLCARHEQEALNSAPCTSHVCETRVLRTDRNVGRPSGRRHQLKVLTARSRAGNAF